MGYPIRKTATRAALIGAMLGGGLLFAGLSQAQDAGVQAERGAELVAAAGGPASDTRLIPYRSDKAAVEAREAEVAGSPAEAGPVARPQPLALSPATAAPAAPAPQPAAYIASTQR